MLWERVGRLWQPSCPPLQLSLDAEASWTPRRAGSTGFCHRGWHGKEMAFSWPKPWTATVTCPGRKGPFPSWNSLSSLPPWCLPNWGGWVVGSSSNIGCVFVRGSRPASQSQVLGQQQIPSARHSWVSHGRRRCPVSRQSCRRPVLPCPSPHHCSS